MVIEPSSDFQHESMTSRHGIVRYCVHPYSWTHAKAWRRNSSKIRSQEARQQKDQTDA